MVDRAIKLSPGIDGVTFIVQVIPQGTACQVAFTNGDLDLANVTIMNVCQFSSFDGLVVAGSRWAVPRVPVRQLAVLVRVQGL